MKFIKLLLGGIFVLLIISNNLFAQNNQIEKYLKQRGEAVIKVDNPSISDIHFVMEHFDIDYCDENKLIFYINPKMYPTLRQSSLNYQLESKYYSQEKSLTMANTLEEMENWDRYPTLGVYNAMVTNFAADYPTICKLETIGTSDLGNPIYALKISDNVNANEKEPEVFLSCQMHGDELVSYILGLRMIDYLLSNYQSDTIIEDFVNSLEIWINPLSNPDGTYGVTADNVVNSTRYNSQGIDLNRNFPDFLYGQNPDGNETATENLAMIDFLNDHNFVISANSHSGAEVVNYPWDGMAQTHPDDEWFMRISREYADTVHANAPSTYLSGFEDGITNGFAWYAISGGRQDYVCYYHHGKEVTLEWSMAKKLNSSELPAHWDYNRDALINYFKNALYGIHGTVTDSLTGNPLEAEIKIQGHDSHNSHAVSKPNNGEYHRLLHEGSYTLKVSAENYYTRTIDITLGTKENKMLDIKLMPSNTVSFEHLDNNISLYPNPVENILHIESNNTNKTLDVEIYDFVGRMIFKQNVSSEEGMLNLAELSKGSYLCKIYIDNQFVKCKPIIKK